MKFKIEEFIRQRREMVSSQRYRCSKDSVRQRKVTDHEGREFDSIRQFCIFYKITNGFYYYYSRLRKMDAAQISLMVLRRRKNEKH